MNFKRFLSLLLCFALVLPSLPLQVKADDPLVIGKSIFEKVATITIRPDKYGLDMAGLSAAGEVATFELSLDDIYAYSVMVDYRTLAGAARPGDHYEHVEGTVVFQPGETTKTVSVNIHWFKAGTTSDDRWEGAYPFFVQFTNPVNATIDTRHARNPNYHRSPSNPQLVARPLVYRSRRAIGELSHLFNSYQCI